MSSHQWIWEIRVSIKRIKCRIKTCNSLERHSKGQFSKYGISRKRYAVFCVCVHKCSACQEKQMDFQGIQKSLPQWGKGDRDSGGWGVPTSRDSSSVSLTAATFSHRRRLFITLHRASKKDRKHIALCPPVGRYRILFNFKTVLIILRLRPCGQTYRILPA